MLQMEYDSIYEQIAKGAIIRSKATWYDKGEKSNKYFLNLETERKKERKLKALCAKFLIEKEFLLRILKRFYTKFIISIPIFANRNPSVHRRMY